MAAAVRAALAGKEALIYQADTPIQSQFKKIGQVEPRLVGDVIYMLANESGKARASRSGVFWRREGDSNPR
nr:DUF927 domain-containing protein [Burkholderia pseudomallei]